MSGTVVVFSHSLGMLWGERGLVDSLMKVKEKIIEQG